MPDAIGRISRPRTGVWNLAEQWAEKAIELRRLGGQEMGPRSELNFDRMVDQIAALEAARRPKPDDPELREEKQKLFAQIQEYDRTVADIKQEQLWLKGAINNWKHRLIADIDETWLADWPEYGMDGITTVAEARVAYTNFSEGPLRKARNTLTGIKTAKAFASLPPGHQAMELTAALARRIEHLEERLAEKRAA
jgi:hypothetical protein